MVQRRTTHTEIESLLEPDSLLPNQFLDPGREVLAEVIHFELNIVLPKSCHAPCILCSSCMLRLVQGFPLCASCMHSLAQGFPLRVSCMHPACIVRYKDFHCVHPACIVWYKDFHCVHPACIVWYKDFRCVHPACILRASFGTRISTVCILRASFGTRILTLRASTPYGYYNIIKAGGGGGRAEGGHLDLLSISIVPTDVFQTGSATRGMLQHEPRRQTNKNRNPKGRQAPLIAD